MNRINKMASKSLILILALTILVTLCAVGCSEDGGVQTIFSEEEYTYINPDESKTDTDEGFVIDGVLDEEAYRSSNWLYLSNKEGGANVEIAMTSYFGEKGMYFIYDVTEGNPIYVNLSRASYLNSCIEMYLAPGTVNNMKGNSIFEIDLMPTGDMNFKKSNGKGGYVNVATTADLMAVLGATTKGGEVNTEDCYGYCLELFIPWEYMEKFDLDTDAMKEGFVYVDPAHITSFNYAGTNKDVDRYWYFFAQEHGATWNNVYQYFRFDGKGVQGAVPVELQSGEHYTIEGNPSVIPGMPTYVTVSPDTGFSLKSILINGEEYIHSANFNDDGSVTIKVRATADGVKISAVAEPVTDGNKTLTGTVITNKLGGGDLHGISASYKGPTGEKPLDLDAEGKFVLTDLKQGLYTIVLEKEGYQKLSRSIYVNRDMDVTLTLEYDQFTATGTTWILDDQNSGVLHRFGGNGDLLTNDSYTTFTASATFKFDTDIEKAGTADAFKQQRQGIKIAFSNGKNWHIDLLKQDGKYYVQYAKHSGDNSVTGWKSVHTLNSAQIAKYTGPEGIQLSVQRAGRYANVYLDGVLVGIEVLDYAYESCTAQVGFESWAGNRTVTEVPYQIQSGISVNLYNTHFKMTDGWDVSRQYRGLVVKTGSGVKRLTFIRKYVNMDLTVTARDYPNSTDKEGVYPRTDILFEFDNGKKMSFGITTNGKTAHIQSIYDEKEADKYINTGWQSWGNLTDEELAQLQSGGVQFRVARYGTEVSLYVGDRLVGVADLTANNSGVTATTPAKVNIRHFDDAGVQVEMPFRITTEFDLVNVTAGDDLAAQKKQYFVGDIVKITAKDSSNYVSSLKVNGKDVTIHYDGTYSFVATEKEYNATGTVAKTIFKPDAQWNILQQNEGLISIPERSGQYSSLYTAANTYRDASVTVTDHENGVFQMQIRFLFANGKEYQLRLDNDAGFYRVQQMGGGACITGWKELAKLTDAQIQQLKSEDGIQLRAALVGTYVKVYLDGTQVAAVDLSSAGITADTTAQIRFLMYGNNGVKNIDIPYTLGGAPATAAVQVASGIQNGDINVGKTDFIVGETVAIKAIPAAGYYLKSLSVTKDGKAVDIGDLMLSGGTYRFVAEEGTYQVNGSFGLTIFKEEAQLDLTKQDEGIVSIPKRTGEYASMLTVANTYREAAVTVRDVAQDGNFQMQIRFYFPNGQKYQVRMYYKADAKQYEIQTMDGIVNWLWIKNLSAAQAEKLINEGVEFRAKLVGSKVELYVDGTKMANSNPARHELSGGGVTEFTTAQVHFLMYGNTDVENITIPYELVKGPVTAQVQVPDSVANGTITVDRPICVAGETVTVTATPAAGYYLKSLRVDGKAVEMPLSGGSYSFTAENGVYKVEGSFGRKVFQEDAQWDLTNQDVGVVSIPKRTGEYASLLTEANTYREAAITARDVLQDGKFQMQIRFYFTNGKKYQVRLYYNADSKEYQIQNMDGITTWGWIQNLDADQIAKLTGSEGVEFRVKLVGSMVELYVDGKPMAYWSASRHDLSSGGITADSTAQIHFLMYGNSDVENIIVPFSVGSGPAVSSIAVADNITNGTIKLDKTSCLAGETVKITTTPAEGYNLKSLTVSKNGTPIDIGQVSLTGGEYSFVTEKGHYTVQAEFAKPVFGSIDTDNSWDLSNQYQGRITLLSKGAKGAFVKTEASTYREAAVTVRDVVQNGTFEMQVRFFFPNGQKYQVRVYFNAGANNGAGQYEMQTMDGIVNWKWIKNLSAAQTEKVKGEGAEFRVKLVGTKVELYLDGVLMAHSDPARHELSGGGVTAETTAQVQFYMVGNSGAGNIVLNYELK